MPGRPGQQASIVHLSIVSALEGHYGDHHRTERVAYAEEESPATAIDELPWEALAGIH